MMDDAIHHEEESDVEEDDEQAAMMMLLPAPPPPPHVKLLDRRCMDCVINHLDGESIDSMAQSCRFFRDACAAADLTPLMRTRHHHHRSDAASAQPSVDALDELSVQAESTLEDIENVVQDVGGQTLVNLTVLSPSSFDVPLDELSHTDTSQDLVNMQNKGDVHVFIGDNPAPSFDEIDEKKGAAFSSCGKLSSDSRNLNRPFDDLRGDEGGPVDIDRTSGVLSCVDLKTDSISVGTPVSFSSTIVTEDLCDRSDDMVSLQLSDAAESEGAEELSAVVSPSAGNATFYTFDSSMKRGDVESLELRAFRPLSVQSHKFTTPKLSGGAYTPSTQSTSNSDDSETADHDEEIRPYDSENVQWTDHDSDGVRNHDDGEKGEYDHLEETTCRGGIFESFFISEFFGDIFGSATEVFNRRNNDIDDHGLIKLGDKYYTQNEALKMWKKAKATLAETYAEVDESGNDKFDATTFFEKSTMYKEKTAKMEEKMAYLGKKKTRNEGPTKRPSKKQGGGMNVAQERKLNKIMLSTFSLQEDEAVIDSLEQNCTQSKAVNEEFDSDNTSNDSSLSNNDQSDNDTSSSDRGDCDPSLSARLPRTRPATSLIDDASVATPVSCMIDSVLGSNYGVEVSSSCCKFVSGRDAPQLIKDAGGYKESVVATKPERVMSTRKPRTLAQHGLGISSSKRRNNKKVKEDKKKSSRSLKLKLMKKATK